MLVVRVLETSEDIQRAIKEAKFDPEEVWPWAFRAVAGVSPRTSSGKKISSQLEQLLLVFVYEVSPIASVVEYSLVGDVDINERALDYIEVMFRSNSRTPNLFGSMLRNSNPDPHIVIMIITVGMARFTNLFFSCARQLSHLRAYPCALEHKR